MIHVRNSYSNANVINNYNYEILNYKSVDYEVIIVMSFAP